MKTIWKYPLKLAPRQVIEIPTSFKFLDAQIQNGEICLWVLHEGGQSVKVDIYIIGTGHELPEGANGYLGTIQQGNFVWHIFW